MWTWPSRVLRLGSTAMSSGVDVAIFRAEPGASRSRAQLLGVSSEPHPPPSRENAKLRHARSVCGSAWKNDAKFPPQTTAQAIGGWKPRFGADDLKKKRLFSVVRAFSATSDAFRFCKK